jgi:hypothetical protein
VLAGNVWSRDERAPRYDGVFTSKEEDKQRWCSSKSMVNYRYVVGSVVNSKIFVTSMDPDPTFCRVSDSDQDSTLKKFLIRF